MRQNARSASAAVIIAAGLSGCAGAGHDRDVLEIAPGSYAAAFDAAAAAARDHGLVPALRDRRGGVIVTEPAVAGSLLEPWRLDNASVGQGAENTLAYQRRRARFEFTAADFQQPPSDPNIGDAAGDGTPDQPVGMQVDPLAVDQTPVDLTASDAAIELRVWVYLERAHVPGLRRSTWTREHTTSTQLMVPERERGQGAGVSWTAVSRDRAYERRLLDAVEASMRR